jgi:hypothetical protein
MGCSIVVFYHLSQSILRRAIHDLSPNSRFHRTAVRAVKRHGVGRSLRRCQFQKALRLVIEEKTFGT